MVDVPLCIQDGITIFRDPTGLYTHGNTWRGTLPPKYVSMAIETATGLRIFPEDGSEVAEVPPVEELEGHGDPDRGAPPGPARFQFQRDLPVEERAAYQRLRAHPRRGRSTPYANPTPAELGEPDQIEEGESPPMPVMCEEWADHYTHSPFWGQYWIPTQDPAADWPAGVRIHEGRMYWSNRLCVPENLCLRVVEAFHQEWGHLGINKMTRELGLRLELPTGMSFRKLAEQVNRRCLICQKTDPPNWQVAQKIEMTPIPPKIFFSVSIDIFSLAATEWAGQEYDCVVLCVDRLSGWMIAKPALKLGLTAEKAAHLMMDDGWNIFGVPSIVTSDQGPHFAGAWWKTVCRRLRVRQVFSQAHRPQANGRAEMAGRVLITMLRKLEAEKAINWVESLPHALRLIHDVSGPSGFSPYQIVFGRDRNLGGIPFEGSECAEEAAAFVDRMRDLDREVASILDAQHAHERDRINKNRRENHPFRVGQLVMLSRPKSVGGNKMKTWWGGPFYLRERRGESSFALEFSPQNLLEVHVDQLKPWHGDLTTGGSPGSTHRIALGGGQNFGSPPRAGRPGISGEVEGSARILRFVGGEPPLHRYPECGVASVLPRPQCQRPSGLTAPAPRKGGGAPSPQRTKHPTLRASDDRDRNQSHTPPGRRRRGVQYQGSKGKGGTDQDGTSTRAAKAPTPGATAPETPREGEGDRPLLCPGAPQAAGAAASHNNGNTNGNNEDKGKGGGRGGGKGSSSGGRDQTPAAPCFECGLPGHWARECPWTHRRDGRRGRQQPQGVEMQRQEETEAEPEPPASQEAELRWQLQQQNRSHGSADSPRGRPVVVDSGDDKEAEPAEVPAQPPVSVQRQQPPAAADPRHQQPYKTDTGPPGTRTAASPGRWRQSIGRRESGGARKESGAITRPSGLDSSGRQTGRWRRTVKRSGRQRTWRRRGARQDTQKKSSAANTWPNNMRPCRRWRRSGQP